MADEATFQQLIGRIRAGDEDAAAELLRRYEPAIEWAAMAAAVGSSPEALRKQWARAVERVAHQLGFDDGTAG